MKIAQIIHDVITRIVKVMSFKWFKSSSFLSRLTHFLVRYCFDLDSHRWFAKGVVSVANDCNEPNRYRICTDIAKYTYWIIQTILEESVTF